MKFIDSNSPGIIFIGSTTHMQGLRNLGGAPQEVSKSFRGVEDLWRVELAPDFWLEEAKELANRV